MATRQDAAFLADAVAAFGTPLGGAAGKGVERRSCRGRGLLRDVDVVVAVPVVVKVVHCRRGRGDVVPSPRGCVKTAVWGHRAATTKSGVGRRSRIVNGRRSTIDGPRRRKHKNWSIADRRCRYLTIEDRRSRTPANTLIIKQTVTLWESRLAQIAPRSLGSIAFLLGAAPPAGPFPCGLLAP